MNARESISHRRALTRSLVGLAAFLACDSPPNTGPDENDTSLSFAIAAEIGYVSNADAGMIRIEGPTPRTESIRPGETKTITGLAPGSYTVALEALLQGQVEAFGEGSVSVVAGQNRQVSITLRSFIPSSVTVAAQTPEGQPITVQWAPVQGATSYLLESSTDAAFANSSSIEVTTTATSTPPKPAGTHFFRVRAKNRFGSVGRATPPGSGAVIRAEIPPTISAYDITILQVDACGAGFRAMATLEQVAYQHPEGNVPVTQPLVESGTPALVESDFRFETDADWRDFHVGKTWTRLQGATGHAGQIRSTSCWSVTDSSTYLDHRFRLQDTRGNWSDWTVRRVMLPATIQITPDTAVVLGAGAAHHYVAVVRDANGSVIPGATNWSNYNNPDVGAIGQDGRYQAAPASNGLDQAYAWAGIARGSVPLRGPLNGAAESWAWAPCWGQPGLSSATSGTFLYYRMRVYAGVEYSFAITPGTTAPSGDPDLYIRLNAQPTTSVYDAASSNSAQAETINWTAPVSGVVWIGIHAFTPFTDVGFGANTTDGRCGFPGVELLRAGPPGYSSASGEVSSAVSMIR